MFLKAAINVHLFILFIYLFFIHLMLLSWLQAGLQERANEAVPDSAAAEVPPGEQQGVPQHPQPEVRRTPRREVPHHPRPHHIQRLSG